MSETAPAAASPATIRLYTQATNPYSEKVAAALALKGLAFERVDGHTVEQSHRG